MADGKESFGGFRKQNRAGKRVNFKNEHDDRFGDDSRGGDDSGYGGGGGGSSRGRGGSSGGRWTRGGRGRGGHRDNNDYGDKKRYTPYNTRGNYGSQRGGRGDSRGGNRRGSVFSRLGLANKQDNTKKGGVFGRLSLGKDDFNQSQTWHKIMIIGGGEGNHDEIIQELQGQIQEPFQAQQVHAKSDKLMFFIEEHRAAMELKQLKDPSVIVKPSPPPRFGNRDGQRNDSGGGPSWRSDRGAGPSGKGTSSWNQKGGNLKRADSDMMEEDSTQVLLTVLGERFDAMNLSIDLGDMFHDRTLQQHNIRGSMYDENFVSSILKLITSHCSNLNAIDLSKNSLRRLDLYSSLKESYPNLQILDLSDNQLNHINCLEALGLMPSIINLTLENNPLQQFHQDFASYAGNVRKYFPNLQILDGQQLPSPVKFDLPSSSGSLPTSQKGYLVNDEIRKLVVSFLEQYYTIYDSETRDKLLEAYSDNAVFSMSVNIPPQQLRNNPYPPGRNLVRVTEAGKRSSLLKRGRIDIVQLLRNLPQSYHLASTFNVDVMQASPSSTAFTVHGTFSEASTGPKSDFFPIRSFTRTFIIVAAGNGVAIINDQLSIRTASHDTIQQHQADVKQHFTPTNPLMASLGQSSTMSSSPFAPAQPSLVPSLNPTGFTGSNPQDEAVARLSAATQMNLDWSRKCLVENNWDYSSSLAAFNHLNAQGSIPSEAFADMSM